MPSPSATEIAEKPAGETRAPVVSPRAIALLMLLLASTTILSQFFRAALAVIAPELISDLALSSRLLGLANGGFFVALLVAQVAVGLAFDKIGPRKTVAALSVLMTIGAAMHALANDGAILVLARLITGFGCAASFMSAVVLVSAWMPPARWSTGLSWVFGASQLGILAAGAPLAIATEWVGWRQAFLFTALLAAMVGVSFFVFVRDKPPGAVVATPAPVAQPGALDGLRQVLSTPGILPVFALFGVAYAAVATVSGLWAGPYLKDIFGFDAKTRGLILTAMAALQMASVFVIGPLDRVFNTRKWLVAAGAGATLLVLAALALVPQLSAISALVLLAAMNLTAGYNTLLLTHMRAHFPNHLAGRGATTGNIAQLLGAAFLPILTGFIPGLFADTGTGYAPDAYRLIFASLAASLAVGLVVYIRFARDIRPLG